MRKFFVALLIALTLPTMAMAQPAPPVIIIPSDRTPSQQGQNNDICRSQAVAGVSNPMMAMIFGMGVYDRNCIRLKDARLLNELGMREAAIQLLCDDPKIAAAMERAKTPCRSQTRSEAAGKPQPQASSLLSPPP